MNGERFVFLFDHVINNANVHILLHL
jgi:hypothetical protein